jgi:predicted RecB family nuclease
MSNIKKNIWEPLMGSNNKKRKNDDINNDDINNDNINNDAFISASATKNYLLRDPLLDWFEIYHNKKRSNSPTEDSKDQNKKRKLSVETTTNIALEKESLNNLFAMGNEFELKITNYLVHTFGDNIKIINSSGRTGCNRENYQKTIDAMITGYPIIVQGVVFNDVNNTFGVFDLIVRSDFINALVSRNVLTQAQETFKAPKLTGNYHYRVIDIKWTTMTLCTNGYTIRNDGRFPCYKGQLAIYNCAIGNIQGYIPPRAYIMAKGWKIPKKGDYQKGFNCFDLLGEIQYDNFDNKYITKTAESLNWRRKVLKEGANWDPFAPIVSEMYPNMSNKNDAPYDKFKKEIATSIAEMTLVWGVTDQHRKNAHLKGIMSWKDPECNSITMGITGNFKPNIIDEILKTNRDPNAIVRPHKIKNNTDSWQKEGPVDFYVDFETINKSLYTQDINIFNSKSLQDVVFMIGVGHIENREFIYKTFYLDNLTPQDEDKIFVEFTKYLNDKISQLDPILKYAPRIFHWSSAEVTNVGHVNDRHFKKFKSIQNKNFVKWVDMYKVFMSEPITVYGALSFKLKDVAKSMHKMGLIKTQWKDDGPSDGLGAMMSAIKYYKNKTLYDLFQSIIDYNEVDCKVMWEIVRYLRNNNIIE